MNIFRICKFRSHGFRDIHQTEKKLTTRGSNMDIEMTFATIIESSCIYHPHTRWRAALIVNGDESNSTIEFSILEGINALVICSTKFT